MAATTYTGNSSTQVISNAVNSVGMQPDLVWVKDRNTARSHYLANSIIGGGNYLSSDSTNAEAITAAGITSFNASGFTTSTALLLNNTGETYVGWQWNAGGTTVTNGTGTISSQVRANTTAGFSVVTYTGNGSASATVGHGLGVIPGMVITKGRSGVAEWMVKHQSLPTGQNLVLNQTLDAPASLTFSGGVIANLTSNATFGFTIGSSSVNNANSSGVTYVAYCWAPVAGYSAFGSYTGNGSADGPFIYTGFRPRWIMIKGSTYVSSWIIFDTSRSANNETKLILYPNDSAAETNNAYGVDVLSNGFKLRQPTGYGSNNSGETYIYAAFAESAFKFSNAR